MANSLTILSTHLKRYQVLERLGVGGMATVYKARDVNLGREVAIKILHEHLVHDDTFKERFEREARLVASFNHPNIVQVYDFDVLEIDGTAVYYMVMPYLQGQNLADLIEDYREKNETMPHERIQQIVSDIASALDYAHTRDMVHRDVKPSNIMFDEHNRAILTDFGIARLTQMSGLTQEDAIIGTPAYMSPEQVTGQEVDFRSDLYALGIIMYEMLTGHVPFEDENTISLLVKHAQEEAPPVSQFLPMKNLALDNVLAKILAKNPDLRYQSGAKLLADFKKAVASESETDRLKPGTMPQQPEKAKLSETQVLSDEANKRSSSINQTIHAMIIKPARQNPLGFIALAIAIFTLLIVARLSQAPSSTPENRNINQLNTIENQNDTGVDSMTGGGAMYFTATFAEDDEFNSYWQGSDDFVERRIEDGAYHIIDTQKGKAVTGIIDTDVFIFDNVHIDIEGQLVEDSDSNSAYGIVFHYHDPANYYVFAVDGIGRFSIWKLENNVWCELRFPCENQDYDTVWTRNEAVLLLGNTNALTVNTYEGQIAAYVNHVQVFELEDETFTSGGVGIYTASTQRGIADLLIDTYHVEAGMPLTGSMTGGG